MAVEGTDEEVISSESEGSDGLLEFDGHQNRLVYKGDRQKKRGGILFRIITR